MFTISILNGLAAGAQIDLLDGGSLVVGRGEECALRLNDSGASRQHCRITVSGGHALVQDLGSSYGTLVNGIRVESCALRAGDRVRVGNTDLSFDHKRIELPPLSAAPPLPREPPPGSDEPFRLRPKSPAVAAPPTTSPPFELETLASPSADLPEPERRAPAKKPAVRPAPTPKVGKRPAAASKRPADVDELTGDEPDDEPDPFTVAKLNSLPGKRFLGYRVESILCRSQTGIVFKAAEIDPKRMVALKIFWPDLLTDPKRKLKFLATVRKMIGIEHPHLVEVLEAGRTKSQCFMATEYVEGESVAGLISRAGITRLHDFRSAWKIAVGVAKALEHAQERGLVHRAVRPSNVLVRKKDGEAKLLDLTVSAALDDAGAERSVKRGQIGADVQFLSPEQASGSADLDGRADVYGLGATLYALLTGHPPFDGSLTETLSKIRTKTPEPIRKFNAAVPAAFEDVILQMLAKRPEDRFPKATAVLKHLNRVGETMDVDDD